MKASTKKLSKSKANQISSFLKALPYLQLSDTGLATIAKRFRTNVVVMQKMANSSNIQA